MGGLNLALRLGEMPWPDSGSKPAPEILLVDPKKRFVFPPLLVDYAINQDIGADEMAPDYATILGRAAGERPFIPGAGAPHLEHVQGRVSRVDWKRRIATVTGEEGEYSLEFDVLVLSPGLLHRRGAPLEGMAGARDVLPFATLEDADALRARLLDESPPRDVAVVGAGYVGVEVSASLAASNAAFRVTLFGPELLPNCEPHNQEEARARLDRLGVARKCGRIEAVRSGSVSWRSTPGAPLEKHDCDLVIVTGAAAAASAECVVEPDPAKGAPVGGTSSSSSRLEVDDYMRIAPGVYCIGDAALAGTKATGQAAMEQAEIAAWNVFAQLTGVRRRRWRHYRPEPMGEFVVLGRDNAGAVIAPARLSRLLPLSLPPAAAASIAPVVALAETVGGDRKIGLSGTAGALLRRLSYLYRMPTLGHKAFMLERMAGRSSVLSQPSPAS